MEFTQRACLRMGLQCHCMFPSFLAHYNVLLFWLFPHSLYKRASPYCTSDIFLGVFWFFFFVAGLSPTSAVRDPELQEAWLTWLVRVYGYGPEVQWV